MSRTWKFSISLIGVTLFWLALTSEIVFRYLPADSVFLVVLVAVAAISTGVLGYRFQQTERNVDRRSSTRNRRRPKPRRGKSAERSGDKSSITQSESTEKARSGKESSRQRRQGRERTQAKSDDKQPTSDEVFSGKIKFYAPDISYGFVTRDDGEEMFFHKSTLDEKTNERQLLKDVEVTFKVVKTARGPVAQGIRIRK